MTQQERIEKFDLKLQKYIDNKSFIKVKRTIFDQDEDLSGFLISMSKDFLFIQIGSDFLLDGYAIIRKDDFDRIRHSSYEKAQRKIFKSEGLIKTDYGFDKEIQLTNWTKIFKALQKFDYHIIVENRNEDYLDFWIGSIVKVTDKRLTILNYDPAGLFDSEPSSIKLDTISIVRFGDRYSTVFRKYLKHRKIK